MPSADSFRAAWDQAVAIGRRRQGLDCGPPHYGPVPGIQRRTPRAAAPPPAPGSDEDEEDTTELRTEQAERRMLLDLYQALLRAGFPLPIHHYVGFGSIFYVDFRMLHKLLRIERMTSIEGYSDLWKRCDYNLPFDNVELHKGISTNFMSSLDRDELYLAWLDYDFPLNKIVADDIASFASTARPSSLVFVTIDLEKPEAMGGDSPADYFGYFAGELPGFAIAGLTSEEFKPQNREATIVKMVERCFSQGIRGRTGLTFEYLIRLTYADGHKMLTIGGMVADEAARSSLSVSKMDDIWFLSRGPHGLVMEIPKFVFTQKEISALEPFLPNSQKLPPTMGIKQSEFDLFRKFYRYWPSYHEALV